MLRWLVGGTSLLLVTFAFVGCDEGGSAGTATVPSSRPFERPTVAPPATSPTSVPTVEPNDTTEPATATPLHTPELAPGSRMIDGCVVGPGAVEIFPPEAAAHGQRVFEDGRGSRWYLRANGTCVHLFLNPDAPPPDFAPETIEPGTPIGF